MPLKQSTLQSAKKKLLEYYKKIHSVQWLLLPFFSSTQMIGSTGPHFTLEIVNDSWAIAVSCLTLQIKFCCFTTTVSLTDLLSAAASALQWQRVYFEDPMDCTAENIFYLTLYREKVYRVWLLLPVVGAFQAALLIRKPRTTVVVFVLSWMSLFF